jgi:hypothetical protein
VNFAFSLVVPINWDFDDSISPLEGNVEDFHIESKTVDGLMRKKVAPDRMVKAFEAALGIFKTRDGQSLDQLLKTRPIRWR